MNRQDIEERASEISTYFFGLPKGRDSAWVDSKLTALAVATLEEAARAGCWYCKNGNAATFDTDDAARSGWYHHFDDETPPETCRRGEIHDLIAALNGEGA